MEKVKEFNEFELLGVLMNEIGTAYSKDLEAKSLDYDRTINPDGSIGEVELKLVLR